MSRRAWFSSASITALSLVACGGSTAPKEPTTAPVARVDHAPSASADPSPPDPPAVEKPAEPAEPPVEIGIAEARPAPATLPTLSITSPAADQVVPLAKVAATMVRLSAKGAPGKLCISLDARPCVDVADPAKPIPLADLGPLEKGQHVLAFFARGDGGEVLRSKKKGAYAIVSFHVDKRDKPTWKAGDPLLVPVLPSGGAGADRTIDFLLANAEAAAGTYLVQLAISGPGISRAESSDDGRPFKLKGARRGTYTVRLALARYSPELGESGSSTTVNYKSKTMTGALVDSTRTFKVD